MAKKTGRALTAGLTARLESLKPVNGFALTAFVSRFETPLQRFSAEREREREKKRREALANREITLHCYRDRSFFHFERIIPRGITLGSFLLTGQLVED